MQKLQQESAVQTGTGFIARTVGVQVCEPHIVKCMAPNPCNCTGDLGNSAMCMQSDGDDACNMRCTCSCAPASWSWRQQSTFT